MAPELFHFLIKSTKEKQKWENFVLFSSDDSVSFNLNFSHFKMVNRNYDGNIFGSFNSFGVTVLHYRNISFNG